MNLHYSQIVGAAKVSEKGLITLWIYTILKRRAQNFGELYSLNTLWIYTILNPSMNSSPFFKV